MGLGNNCWYKCSKCAYWSPCPILQAVQNVQVLSGGFFRIFFQKSRIGTNVTSPRKLCIWEFYDTPRKVNSSPLKKWSTVVGGWTNPFHKNIRQNRTNLPRRVGVKFQPYIWVATMYRWYSFWDSVTEDTVDGWNPVDGHLGWWFLKPCK